MGTKSATIDRDWIEAEVISVKRLKGVDSNDMDGFQVTYVYEGHRRIERISHRMYEMLCGQGFRA